MKKLTLPTLIILICVIPLGCTLLSFLAAQVYKTATEQTWVQAIPPRWRFSSIISYDPPNLFLYDSGYGKCYACDIDAHECILSPCEKVTMAPYASKFSHRVPFTFHPRPSGKISDSITIRIPGSGYVDVSFILLEDGSVWSLHQYMHGLEALLIFVIKWVGLPIGIIIDVVVLIIAWAKK